MDEEIKRLHERTERTRYQFLTVELQTCFTAIELARYQLSIGNLAVAEKEVADVEKGLRVIHRFLPELSAEEKTKVAAEAAELQSQLDSLKSDLHPHP